MNVPNKLTVFRAILVPFFVFFMLVDVAGTATKWIAVVVFVIASLTDLADGYIARKNNLVTDFGKFMDPLADKLLVCSALICMCGNKIPAWIVVIIIGREFIISGFRLIACEQGVVIAAGWWGKIKTVVQMIMVIVLIVDLKPLYLLGQILIYASVILTLISLIDYIVKNKQVLTKGGL